MRTDRAYLCQLITPSPVIEIFRMLRILNKAIGKVRVGIIGINIQGCICHFVIIQVLEHAVGGNEISRLDIFSQNIALHFTETDSAVGYKADIIQHFMWICRIMYSQSWYIYLFPLSIFLIPEYSSPGPVQFFQGSVFFL